MFRQLLILLHLLGAFAWVGGMFFAYFCLRPAAAEVLEPAKRLPLWCAAFARFLPYVAVAVAVILATGFALFGAVGFAGAPPGWHAMLALGLLMTAVFGHIWLVRFPRLRAHCTASAWPEAARVLDGMRRLVAFNLVLGVATVVAAASAR
ncbi:MAG: hypothetical protein GX576_07010 [Thauera phenolivorans]|uniref:Copper resistance protein D domain-containing protein n=1 Tax=Thauera phenolivorans TaxID=1792543 RepID=A0A7X7R7V0_9RHOO|nr:CopD family protein [Thauera phenolivorans]NLF54132.1 hypothetical protein [Thauera phenolivorans]